MHAPTPLRRAREAGIPRLRVPDYNTHALPGDERFRLARPVVAAELPVLLALTPLLLFPSPKRLLVLLVVPVIWACATIGGGRFVPKTAINIPLWTLLTMAVVSLFVTFDVSQSLGKVSGLFLGVLFCWAIVRWASTGDRLKLLIALYLAAGAGLAVLGLLGTNWFDKFPILGGVIARLPRSIRGVPGAEQGFHPNEVAGCLVLFLPLQVGLLLSGTGAQLAGRLGTGARRKWLVGVQVALLLLTAGTLVLTQSRGAWTGMALASLVFLAWYGRRTRLVAALAVGVCAVLAVWLGPARVANLAINRSGPGMAANISGRLELWSCAVEGIGDFPLTGMGMNVFRKVMPVLYPTAQSSPRVDIAHAHNLLLQAALDLGIPGLVAYVAIWVTVAVLLVSAYRRSDERLWRVAAGGLGAGLVAHFAFGTTDAVALGAKAGVVFWLAVGLAVAVHRTELRTTGPSPGTERG
jgi:putative inorganic carbon (hco3(-)) transporter